MDLSKSSDDDPYSFYILDKIAKEKRFWKMDCRLEDVSMKLMNIILPHLIKMFRNIYKLIFGDNDFRKDYYQSSNQIIEYDCEQLLQNILLISCPKNCRIMTCDIIKNKSTYKPTENDKFNLYGDDVLQKRKFNMKDDYDVTDIIKRLFDSITSQEAVDFYRNKFDFIT